MAQISAQSKSVDDAYKYVKTNNMAHYMIKKITSGMRVDDLYNSLTKEKANEFFLDRGYFNGIVNDMAALAMIYWFIDGTLDVTHVIGEGVLKRLNEPGKASD